MNTFNLNDIDEFQLEITSYCNAACPQCPRNINGGETNPYLPVVHLSREVLDRTFTASICKDLRQIFFCGSYGDPIMHPDFLKILEDFRFKNPTLWLYMHTNGGARKPEWWAEVADILDGHGQIDFNIDGLEDTNNIYRCGTDFNRIIDNATAFINAGGRANWNYIVFEHNEHQVEEANTLANNLGFNEFNVRPTGRFFNHSTMAEIKQWPIANSEQVLEAPKAALYKNKSVSFLPNIKSEYGSFKKYADETKISCDALGGCDSSRKTKIVVTSEGLVTPCNFFQHNLHDARFHDRDVLPSSNDLSFLPNGKNQVRDLFERHNYRTELNINHASLDNILANDFWNEISNSFNKTLDNGRIFECAMTCGGKFHKVWDQLNMKENTFLITGGNRGLGLELINHFRGSSMSRKHDIDITNPDDREYIADKSLGFDVFINNAFDGPAGDEHANFAQTELLIKVFDKWKEANKTGYIINIGSSALKEIVAPEPSFERYRVSKAALQHASKQCTRAFRENQVSFKTTIINFDRLDTPLSRSRDNWTGNGTPCSDVVDQIELILKGHPNTCYEEFTSWLNKDYEL